MCENFSIFEIYKITLIDIEVLEKQFITLSDLGIVLSEWMEYELTVHS